MPITVTYTPVTGRIQDVQAWASFSGGVNGATASVYGTVAGTLSGDVGSGGHNGAGVAFMDVVYGASPASPAGLVIDGSFTATYASTHAGTLDGTSDEYVPWAIGAYGSDFRVPGSSGTITTPIADGVAGRKVDVCPPIGPSTPSIEGEGTTAGFTLFSLIDHHLSVPTNVTVTLSALSLTLTIEPVTLTSCLPTHGGSGTAVTIAGTGFLGGGVSTLVGVSFGGIPCETFTVESNTLLHATVPAVPTSGDLVVALAYDNGNGLVPTFEQSGLFTADTGIWCYNPTSNHYIFVPGPCPPPFVSSDAPTITVTGVSPRST